MKDEIKKIIAERIKNDPRFAKAFGPRPIDAAPTEEEKQICRKLQELIGAEIISAKAAKPLNKRMTPAEIGRLGELSRKKLNSEEAAELRKLESALNQDRPIRDRGGPVEKGEDGKIYAPQLQRYFERIATIRHRQLNQAARQKHELEYLLLAVERGDNIFMKHGYFWVISYAGRRTILKPHKGFFYLAELLKEPKKGFSPSDLYKKFTFNMPPDEKRAKLIRGDIDHENDEGEKEGQPGLTISAMPEKTNNKQIPEYLKKQKSDLEAVIADFRSMGDTKSMHESQRELKELVREENKLYGTKKRPRPESGSRPEQIRRSVDQAIRRAMRKIGNKIPSLGKHLINSVKTMPGPWSYQPTGKPPKWTTG